MVWEFYMPPMRMKARLRAERVMKAQLVRNPLLLEDVFERVVCTFLFPIFAIHGWWLFAVGGFVLGATLGLSATDLPAARPHRQPTGALARGVT